ncbi:MAG: bacillithiol biosynthesis cysteine-adding enzyme BshC [Bacillota bacterium]
MPLRVEREKLQPPSPLVAGYLHAFERVGSFYRYNPHSAESMAERLGSLAQTYRRDRRKLVAALLDYNRGLGAGKETLNNIALLEARGAAVVVGGQQAGVLTGPLYTVHKALTIIQLARKLSSQLGAPVVPVFWVAAEDHDFAEISPLDFQAANGEPTRLRLAPPPGAGDSRSVGDLPAGPEVAALIDALDEATPPSEFKAPLLDGVREALAAGGSLADFFANLMLRLFGRHGLVLIDVTRRPFRAMQSGFFRAAIESTGDINAAVEEAGERLVAAGHSLQVEKSHDHTHLFIYVDGQRLPLFREPAPETGPGGETEPREFVARRGRQPMAHFTRAELLAIAKNSPWELSTDVITRPVGQDYLLPVLASVDGPGEISYLAQVKHVYPLFDQEMPVIYPRANITLVERSVARALDKFGLTVRDLAGDQAAHLEEFLRQLDPTGVQEAVDRLKSDLAECFRRCWETLTPVDKTLPEMGRKNLDRVMAEVSWFERKAVEARNRAADDAARQYKRAAAALFPEGHLQERVYNIYPYLFKYGDGLIDLLVEAPLIEGTEHKLVYIE